MPKPPLIFVVLYVLLAAISVVAIDLRLLLVPAASAVLVLVAAGFVVFRPFRTVMAIPWPAHSETEGEQTPVVINGNACHCQGYEQDLLIEIVTRHLLELLTCLLLAGATLCAIGVNMWRSNHFPQIGAFQAEFICMAGLVALLVALRWFTERRFLSAGRIAFGAILGVDHGPLRRVVAYQFFDQQHERRGGRGPLLNDADNVILVIYWPADPDTNVSHGAFRFHRFRVQLLPGRRKVTMHTGVDH